MSVEGMKSISEYADIIDSREVIARIDYLDIEPAELADNGERAELEALRKLAEEAESSPDWLYGETLIRDSYFTTYAQELAEDIGAVPSEHSWPNYCIDWEWAARELQVDYMDVEFNGVTYWIRA